MDLPTNETWRFSVIPGQADKVYLVLDGPMSPSRWVEMSPDEAEPTRWSVSTELAPGRTRVRYFTALNGTYLNCGTAGLLGLRTSDANAAVHLDDFTVAASA